MALALSARTGGPRPSSPGPGRRSAAQRPGRIRMSERSRVLCGPRRPPSLESSLASADPKRRPAGV